MKKTWMVTQKGYVDTCTNQPGDSLLQTIVTVQADEYTGPVIRKYVQYLLVKHMLTVTRNANYLMTYPACNVLSLKSIVSGFKFNSSE